MRVHHNVCCGIEVQKKSVKPCLMWGPADQEPTHEIRRFGTMTRELQKLAEWLEQGGCEVATMESTGSYWKPVWNALEKRRFKLILANAHHVCALPGEKTDRRDGKRLADLMRHGQVRASYIPQQAILQLRDLTRYRSMLAAGGYRSLSLLRTAASHGCTPYLSSAAEQPPRRSALGIPRS